MPMDWRNAKDIQFLLDKLTEMQDNSVQMARDLRTFVYQLRIKADVEVIEMVSLG